MARPSLPRVFAPPKARPSVTLGVKERVGGFTHCSPISAAQSGEQTPSSAHKTPLLSVF